MKNKQKRDLFSLEGRIAEQVADKAEKKADKEVSYTLELSSKAKNSIQEMVKAIALIKKI